VELAGLVSVSRVGHRISLLIETLGTDIAVRAIGHRAKPFHSVSYFSFYCIVVSVM
jgi:hypothetical protein